MLKAAHEIAKVSVNEFRYVGLMKCKIVISFNEPAQKPFELRSAIDGFVKDRFERVGLAGGPSKRREISRKSFAFGEIPMIGKKIGPRSRELARVMHECFAGNEHGQQT